MNDKDWLSTPELAEWLGLDKQALYWMRYRGTAPKAYLIAGKLRWRRSDVEAWIAEQAA
jgi:predicted DNA-binding transcriptional regulator AlpA